MDAHDEDDVRPSEAAGDYPPTHFVPGPDVVIRGVIGRGGHGTVYEAELPSIGKVVALKVLHEFLKHDPQLAERIVAEGRTLAQLEHPNIVVVYNAGFTRDERNLPWILLEHLRGKSGRTILERKKRLPIDHALGTLIPLAKALHFAHERNVIHQDIKPENIFIHQGHDNRSITKLCDFSIQRRLDPRTVETPGGAPFEGTLPYAAPEQIVQGHISVRTDIYAFGVVLFEFLTGKRPFHEAEERDRLEESQRGLDVASQAPSSSALRSWVVNAKLSQQPAPKLRTFGIYPAALEALVAKCLEREPKDRPATMAEVAQGLTSILQKLGAEFRDAHQTTQDFLDSQIIGSPQRAQPSPPAAAVSLAPVVSVAPMDASPAALARARSTAASSPTNELVRPAWSGTLRLDLSQMPPATFATSAEVPSAAGQFSSRNEDGSPGVNPPTTQGADQSAPAQSTPDLRAERAAGREPSAADLPTFVPRPPRVDSLEEERADALSRNAADAVVPRVPAGAPLSAASAATTEGTRSRTPGTFTSVLPQTESTDGAETGRANVDAATTGAPRRRRSVLVGFAGAAALLSIVGVTVWRVGAPPPKVFEAAEPPAVPATLSATPAVALPPSVPEVDSRPPAGPSSTRSDGNVIGDAPSHVDAGTELRAPRPRRSPRKESSSLPPAPGAPGSSNPIDGWLER